ncbi:MAG: HAD family hydrolase [Anaerolineae bacterium]|nr:HAD family hydrolase [Anaerolineae bacterium]
MLKAVIFDLDHTLIDWGSAEPWEDYQFRRIERVYDFTHQYLTPLDGVSAKSFFQAYTAALTTAWTTGNQTFRAPDIRRILAETALNCGVPRHRVDADALLDVYDWQIAPGERAFPDVIDVLPELRAHGLQLGIVTNASHPMVLRDRELDAFGILEHFPTCRIAAVDVGVIKPHRLIFDRALDRLAVRPDEAVFVGDNLEADIQGAQGAGMVAVWRAPGADAVSDTATDDSNIVPDGIINTLHDLLPILDGWYPGWRNGHMS